MAACFILFHRFRHIAGHRGHDARSPMTTLFDPLDAPAFPPGRPAGDADRIGKK